MRPEDALRSTPWDSAAYGVDAREILEVSADVLAYAAATPGHYTAKVDPLSSKKLLHEFGFYYCDTLIEPYCTAGDLVRFERHGVAVTTEASPQELLAICHGAFSHDRFHRDFNLSARGADARYDTWLAELQRAGGAYGLILEDRLAGFIALSGNRMVLHAVAREFRGRGLAKYLWSAACGHFFDRLGIDVLESSVSAANLPVVNLYASLGFRFRNARDVYHLMVGAAA
jgi:ribosomal protein S18 acetylase RimI-like enzyme